MKQRNTFFLLSIISFISLQAKAQGYDRRGYSPHDGFNFSIFAGAAGGHIKFEEGDSNHYIIKGVSPNFCVHLGYSIKNWTMGLSVAPYRMVVNSVSKNGMDNPTNKIQYIDHTYTGLYFTRYFMWINIFLTVEGGVSSFNVLYKDTTEPSQTKIGFAWNARVGKEFILGKRKNGALGFYINFGGLKAYEQAPFNKNFFSYMGPGGGVAFSFH